MFYLRYPRISHSLYLFASWDNKACGRLQERSCLVSLTVSPPNVHFMGLEHVKYWLGGDWGRLYNLLMYVREYLKVKKSYFFQTWQHCIFLTKYFKVDILRS